MFDEGLDGGGIDTSATRGDLVEELAEDHFIVVGGHIFEWEDPSLFGDGLEEEAAESLDHFDEALAFELDRVQQFGFDADSVGGIALDLGVVRWQRDGETVKGVAPFALLVGVGVQKAQETIDTARDIGGLEEVGKGLSDCFDFVVSWGGVMVGKSTVASAKRVFTSS